MAYLHHIDNLYKRQEILLFKRCFALEKAHGTSIKITYNPLINEVRFFSGGASHEEFIRLFNQEFLLNKFKEIFQDEVIFYGECIGGKMQGMSHTYGKNMCAIFFEAVINNKFLSVPKAEQVIKNFGLEFVPYNEISTDLKEIDRERDRDSEIAIRKGMGNGHIREGIVLRPLEEFTLNNGERVICKHKRDEFRETKTPRPIVNPDQLKVLEDADKIADEFVTAMRLNHILDKIPNHSIEKMSEIISAMISDIMTEGKGEVVDNQAVRKSISKKTAIMYKNLLKQKLSEIPS